MDSPLAEGHCNTGQAHESGSPGGHCARCMDPPSTRKAPMGTHSLSVVISGLLLLSACRGGGAPAAPPAPTVQVVPVVQKDVPIIHEWIGGLDGFVNAEIKPQVSGYVMAQVYRDGV